MRSGRTILGAISTTWTSLKYIIRPSTRTEYVLDFLEEFRGSMQPGAVIVLDNHTSHKAIQVRSFCEDEKIDLLFTPPCMSTLNPVEKMWGLFKRHFRTNADVHNQSLEVDDLIINSMEAVSVHSEATAKAPLLQLYHLLKH